MTLLMGKYQIIFIAMASLICGLPGALSTCCKEEFGGEFTAIQGGRATIPCNATIPRFKEAISLIMWYKGESEVPIYTLDVRKGTLQNAIHIVGDELRPRAHFDISEHPPLLKIDPVREKDAGMYKCRVDFRWSRTMYQEAKLNVVVPPRRLFILNSKEEKVMGTIGPFQEGDVLSLQCIAQGGKPTPSLTWWRDGELLDDTFTVVNHDIVRNEFVIRSLKREDIFSELSCQASNTNYTDPVNISVILDMNLRPIEVKITSPQRPLLAREKTQITCTSFGSRPAANIHWWKDRKKLTSFATMVKEKNYTLSELTFIPEIEDNSRYLSCEAVNPLLPNRGLEDGWILNVHYDPQVILKLGSNIQLETIAEGNDVYFECHVQANPWVDNIVWLHEGIPIRNKQEDGIIISNQSLVLQRIKITSRGKYQCIAYNSQGSGRSNKIEISLKYIPVCCDHREQVYRLAKNESAIITCCVDANPKNVDFFWTLNNSQEMVNIHSFYVNKTTSVLTYRPRNEIDYGILLCWAKNGVGEQKEPCIYNIISVGRPSSLQNCMLYNITARGFAVRCRKGYDGGLNQTFHLEIYSSLKDKFFFNLTQNKSPAFLVTKLPPSTSFIVRVYASNSKGRSNLVVLTATTSPATQELKGDPKTTPINPTLAIVIGVVGTLIVLAVTLLIFSRCRRCRKIAGHEQDEHKKTQVCPQENIDPNFTSKIKSEAITTPTDLSLGNGKILRRREIDTFYGIEMENLPTHNISPIFKGESRNLEYPCGTSGWSTAISSV